MHKHIPVIQIEIDDITSFILKIGKIYNQNHLPIGIPIRREIVDKAALNEWWTDRAIPYSRSGVSKAKETLGIKYIKGLIIRCNGLSLSDKYWIKPENSDLKWENINFFSNSFSEDIGDVLLGANKKTNSINFSSPDNTCDGCLKKRWKIIDGKRLLVKGGSNPYCQQPFNEVIADKIMDRLGIDHIQYSVIWNKGAPYSVCEDFVDENTELIPAWRIYNSSKKKNNVSVYNHFVNCCENLGINGITPFLDKMITLDYIIANEDRHLNNFGVLRNAETLEWIKIAPIYDSGSSLGYDKVPAQIKLGAEITCKPFKNKHEEQLKLVKSFEWLELNNLHDIDEIVASSFIGENIEDYIDKKRIEAITESVKKRIEKLREIISKNSSSETDSTANDVKENIAEDYT